MNARKHINLLIQSVVIWAAFWVVGLPDYYQQYSTIVLAVACTVLSVLISLAALAILTHGRPENRRARAFWCSVYYTVVFAALDTGYCAIYLGHGAAYLWRYWYLTVFYVTPWLTFIPTAMLLERMDGNRKPAAV